MTSPRRDLWRVQGSKPRDIAAFDRAVPQPFAASARPFFPGPQTPSSHVYELFPTEAEARLFADRIRAHGATHVNILPPDGHGGRPR